MYVILEFPQLHSRVVQSDSPVETLMAEQNCLTAFAGVSYDPDLINHNHLLSARTDWMWAVIKPTPSGYELLGLSALPVVDALDGQAIALKIVSRTDNRDGQYTTTFFGGGDGG